MTDTVFRTKVEPTVEAPQKAVAIGPAPSVTSVEVPYTAYESEHGKPLSADYFELGDLWNDANGGFSKEISTIEEYFTKKIESGEIENSIKAIKEKLKSFEKLSNTHKDERKTIRLETVSAYVKFLMDSDNIRYNIKRYGNT